MSNSNTTDVQKPCFVLCPIGEADTPIRDRSDQVFEFAISPAAVDCGYKAERADHESRPGVVTTQIVCAIRDAEMIVADLTGPNPNVMYELGVAHALGKRIVTIIDEEHKLPFDTAPQRTIQYRFDARGVNRLKAKVAEAIKAAETDTEGTDSPVKAAQAITALRQSNDPTAEVLERLTNRLTRLEVAYADIPERTRSLLRDEASPVAYPRFYRRPTDAQTLRAVRSHGWSVAELADEPEPIKAHQADPDTEAEAERSPPD